MAMEKQEKREIKAETGHIDKQGAGTVLARERRYLLSFFYFFRECLVKDQDYGASRLVRLQQA